METNFHWKKRKDICWQLSCSLSTQDSRAFRVKVSELGAAPSGLDAHSSCSQTEMAQSLKKEKKKKTWDTQERLFLKKKKSKEKHVFANKAS